MNAGSPSCVSELNQDAFAEILMDQLAATGATRVLVGYSGGMDSTALLHLVAGMRKTHKLNVLALHCNHGIAKQSDDWERRCARSCRSLSVKIARQRLHLGLGAANVSEAQAREARYAWFAELVGEGDLLLTAHHESDQAETLLLNLLRGAGARGLAAIQPVSRFSLGHLGRPLLSVSKEAIEDYAKDNELDYVRDPANENLRFSRSYIRSVIMRPLVSRWPKAMSSIAGSAALLSQARGLLDELASADLNACATDGTARLNEGAALDVERIMALSRPRQINLLRYWVRNAGIPEPQQSKLDNFLDTVLSGAGGSGKISWQKGGRISKYRGTLYLMRSLPKPSSQLKIKWDAKSPLVIEEAGLKLIPEPAEGEGLRQALIPDGVTVRFRRGGESIVLPRRRHASELKKILQAEAVPPWERELLPLIYVGDELVAVVPLAVSDRYGARAGQKGISIRLEPACRQARQPRNRDDQRI